MIPPLGFFLAAFGIDLPKSNRPIGRLPGLLLSDVLVIIGVGLALLLVLAFCIYLWKKLHRKRRRHISSGEKVYRGPPGDEAEPDPLEHETAPDPPDHDDEDNEGHTHDHHHHQGRRRYKYRVRRRTHRSRNPTLSETGGLPPVKPPEPTKPF